MPKSATYEYVEQQYFKAHENKLRMTTNFSFRTHKKEVWHNVDHGCVDMK